MKKIEVEVKFTVDERLEKLISKAIDALWDLAQVIAPLTGQRIVRED